VPARLCGGRAGRATDGEQKTTVPARGEVPLPVFFFFFFFFFFFPSQPSPCKQVPRQARVSAEGKEYGNAGRRRARAQSRESRLVGRWGSRFRTNSKCYQYNARAPRGAQVALCAVCRGRVVRRPRWRWQCRRWGRVRRWAGEVASWIVVRFGGFPGEASRRCVCSAVCVQVCQVVV